MFVSLIQRSAMKIQLSSLLLFIFFVFFTSLSIAQTNYVTGSGKKLGLADFLELAAQKEKAGDNREASRYLNEAATVHWERKEFDKAIEYFERSLKLNDAIGNEQGMSGINSNLGMIYADKQQYAKAVDYFDKVLEFRQKGKDKESLISSYVNASVALNNIKGYEKSAMYLEAALELAQEMNNVELMKSCYGMLSETYTKAGEAEKAKKYFDMYRTFHEMLQRDKELVYKQSAEEARLRMELVEVEKRNKELALASAQKEIQEQEKSLTSFDSANHALVKSMTKQELAAKLQQVQFEQKQQEQENKLKEERLIRYAFLAILVGILIFGLFFYSNYREKRNTYKKLKAQHLAIIEQQELIITQKTELEKNFSLIEDKNQNITASITYAQRIQAAMLTDIQNLQKLVPESFILFKPRDIVSGDFYWFREYTNENHEKIIVLAAVDCTGHGVPGAFMSMIGSNLLTQIIANTIISPELVLQELHRGITVALHQEDGQNKDGMDMVFCSINQQQHTMEFAGAKNPLFYIQNGQLYEIKGDRHPIGGKDKDDNARIFTKHTVDITQPTYIYLFTDGYQDQFGGADNRKFMIKRMRELFLNIYTEPMQTQKMLLKTTIQDWKGKEHQVDDILVMGCKV